MKLIRKFIDINISLSKLFDKLIISDDFSIDGNNHFKKYIAPSYLKYGMKVYDVGGGKQPFIDVKTKKNLNLQVIGIDISQSELDQAPLGIYDSIVCHDISNYLGIGDGDLVICQTLLEHVRDTESAIQSIKSLLKPKGKALIFVPSRNAIFARMNMLIPQKIKRYIIFSIFPATKKDQGFQAYYNKCTPNELISIAKKME